MGSRSRPLGTLGVGGDAPSPPGSSVRGRLGGLGTNGGEAGPSAAAPAAATGPASTPRLTPAERFKPKPQPRSTRRAVLEVRGWVAG